MVDLFFDGRTAPSPDALDRLLAERAGLWRQLTQRIEDLGGVGQWAWGGPKYGWELKFKRGVKPFATLTPKPEGFVALVILGGAEVSAVDPAELGEHMRATFESARQLPDGRWLFHPIESERDVADTAAVLALKLPPTIRARLAGSRGG
ncbi:MAG: DUF3788 family protein [Candidatus Limnocylindrales bacterium]|jgi:hypothetical protein